MTVTQNFAFDRIIHLETEVRVAQAQLAFAHEAGDRDRARATLTRVRPKLYAAVDALTADEQRAFGEYRAEIAGRTPQPTPEAESTVVRIAASELRVGDQVVGTGGRLHTLTKVWRSRDAHLFAGSRARVETVQAHHVNDGGTPSGWNPDERLTVIRPIDA